MSLNGWERSNWKSKGKLTKKRRQQLRGKVTKLTAQKEYEERKDYN